MVPAGTRLRFGPGDRVECCICTRSFEDRWQPGVIASIFYREEGFARGMFAAYQVRLDDGRLVYSPSDEARFVRASAAVLRPAAHPSWPSAPRPADFVSLICCAEMPLPLPVSEFVSRLSRCARRRVPEGEQRCLTPLGLPPPLARLVVGVCGLSSFAKPRSPLSFLSPPSAAALEPSSAMSMARRALLSQPASCSSLCALLAHTPRLSDGTLTTGGLPGGLGEVHGHPRLRWRFTGDWDDPDGAAGAASAVEGGGGGERLSPPQSGACYVLLTHHALSLLALVADGTSNGGAGATRLLCASPHFPSLVCRLVELVCRHDEDRRLMRLPGLALSLLVRLASAQPRVLWLLTSPGACHTRWDMVQRRWVCADPSRLESALRIIQRSPGEGRPLAAAWQPLSASCGNGVGGGPGEYVAAMRAQAADLRAAMGAFRAVPPGPLSEGGGPRAEAAAAEVEAAFDALVEALPAGSGGGGGHTSGGHTAGHTSGVPSCDSLSDELARCCSEAARSCAMRWLTDAVLLPPGRAVALRGLAGRPELNGCCGVVDGTRNGGRYPVWLFCGGGGAAPLPLAVRPHNLALLADDAAAEQVAAARRAARRERREARSAPGLLRSCGPAGRGLVVGMLCRVGSSPQPDLLGSLVCLTGMRREPTEPGGPRLWHTRRLLSRTESRRRAEPLAADLLASSLRPLLARAGEMRPASAGGGRWSAIVLPPTVSQRQAAPAPSEGQRVRLRSWAEAAGAWLVEEEGGAHRRLAVPPERLALVAPSTALAGQEEGPRQSRAVALLQVPYGVLAADGEGAESDVRHVQDTSTSCRRPVHAHVR